MAKESVFIVGFAFGVIVGVVLMAFILRNEHQLGQIDALTGNIHYELITHDDSTRTWERIEP